MSADRLSLSEFAEFLDDSEGHELAQFLMKKSCAQRPAGGRIFNNEPERFSLNVKLKRLSTPPVPAKAEQMQDDVGKDQLHNAENVVDGKDQINTSELEERNAVDLPTANEVSHSDKGKNAIEPISVCDPHQLTKNHTPPVKEKSHLDAHQTADQHIHISRAISVEENLPDIPSICVPRNVQITAKPPEIQQITEPSSAQKQEAQNSKLPQPEIPMEQQRECEKTVLSATSSAPATPHSLNMPAIRSPASRLFRSGGVVSSADRLRRQVLKRRSSCGKRMLLKEFESTISNSADFAPQVCSTPMSHHQTPVECEQAENTHQTPSKLYLSKQEEVLLKTIIEDALEKSMTKVNALVKTLQENNSPKRTAAATTDMPPNASPLPGTQDLLQQAQAQCSFSGAAPENRGKELFTQELLQQVQNTLNDIRKSKTQSPNIVLPVNQTFNMASPLSTTTNQSLKGDGVLNATDCDKTLTGAMAHDQQPNATLTHSRVNDCEIPVNESLKELSKQNSCHQAKNAQTFVIHPTFTQYNDTNDTRNLMELNSPSPVHNSTQSNNKLLAATCVEHAQMECCPAELSHNNNNTHSNKAHETCREHTLMDCCSSQRSIAQNRTATHNACASMRSQLQCSIRPENNTQLHKADEGVSLKHSATLRPTEPAKSKVSELNGSRTANDSMVRFSNSHTVITQNQSLAKDAFTAELSNVGKQSPTQPRRSILKNRNVPAKNSHMTPTRRESVQTANSALITDDEDDISNNASRMPPIDKRRAFRKSGPLNLAPERRKPYQTRSRRKRKCTVEAKKTASSMITSDTEDAEAAPGPPRAHPLNLRHTRKGGVIEILPQGQLAKRPLNKAPNTPKNGERFADELKAHLARLTNHEILDLRKRNSIGEALIPPARLRKSTTTMAPNVAAKQALQQKLQIEEQIQLEILRRELLGEAEGLHDNEEEEEEAHNDEREQAQEVMDENVTDSGLFAELTAPDGFKDNTTDNSVAAAAKKPSTTQQMIMQLTGIQAYNSSLIDDNSTERVTFIQPNRDSTISRGRPSRSRVRKSKDLPEITKRYIEIQKKVVRKRRKPSTSKRSLYNKGDSTTGCDDNPQNVSSEKENCPQVSKSPKTPRIEPIPPPPIYATPTKSSTSVHIPSPPPPLITPTTPTSSDGAATPPPSPIYDTHAEVERITRASVSSASARRRFYSPPASSGASTASPSPPTSPLPALPLSPPALFSTTHTRRTASTTAKSPAPPLAPPTAYLDNCATNNNITSTTTATTSAIISSTSNQVGCQTDDDELFKKPTMPAPRKYARRNTKAAKGADKSQQQQQQQQQQKQINDTQTTDDDAEGLRRSKRGQVPRKQVPACVFSMWQTIEEISMKNKLRRLNKMRDSKSLSSDVSGPVASSTVRKPAKGGKRGRRPASYKAPEMNMFSLLGDTNTTSGTVYSTKGGAEDGCERLQAIAETSMESADDRGQAIATSEESDRDGRSQSTAVPPKQSAPQAVDGKKMKKKAGGAATTRRKRKEVEAGGAGAEPEGAVAGGERKKKAQKRKQKAAEKQMSAEQQTTADKPSSNSQSDADGYIVNERMGVLELSRVNGPPPPPRHKLNELFEQLKNAANNNNGMQSDDEMAAGAAAAEIAATATSSSATTSRNSSRKIRVRLRRCKGTGGAGATTGTSSATSASDTEATTASTSSSHARSTSSTSTQANAQNQLYTWLRNVSYSTALPTSLVKETAINFKDMRTSAAGNLYFTNLEGIDYAFYDTDDKYSLGYLRFQPLQHKQPKRAKRFNLHFLVLAGTFRFGTDNERGTFQVGDMVAINIGKRYEITNLDNDISVLMVIKK